MSSWLLRDGFCLFVSLFEVEVVEVRGISVDTESCKLGMIKGWVKVRGEVIPGGLYLGLSSLRELLLHWVKFGLSSDILGLHCIRFGLQC